jgi:hypothetical protein
MANEERNYLETTTNEFVSRHINQHADQLNADPTVPPNTRDIYHCKGIYEYSSLIDAEILSVWKKREFGEDTYIVVVHCGQDCCGEESTFIYPRMIDNTISKKQAIQDIMEDVWAEHKSCGHPRIQKGCMIRVTQSLVEKIERRGNTA